MRRQKCLEGPHKNKCGLGQPPGPHCYRGRSDCRLSPGRKIIAQLHSEKCYAVDAHLKLALQGYDSVFPSSLEEGFLRRPQSPGTGALDMRRISPGDSLSRSPATLNPCRNRFRTSRAFDCKHFAAAETLTQRQSAAPLCKNCGAEKLPVERKGKVYFYSQARERGARNWPASLPPGC